MSRLTHFSERVHLAGYWEKGCSWFSKTWCRRGVTDAWTSASSDFSCTFVTRATLDIYFMFTTCWAFLQKFVSEIKSDKAGNCKRRGTNKHKMHQQQGWNKNCRMYTHCSILMHLQYGCPDQVLLALIWVSAIPSQSDTYIYLNVD